MERVLFGGAVAPSVSSSSIPASSLGASGAAGRLRTSDVEAPTSGVRQAAPAGRAITVKAGPDGNPPLAAALRETLSRIFHALGRGNPKGAEEATDRAAVALGGLLSADALASASGIEIRIVSQSVAVDDSGSGRRAGVFLEQFALEIGVVKDRSVRAEDTRLLKLDGREIALTDEARKAGLADGRYVREESGAFGKLDERTRKALDSAREALEQIRAVQRALSAYREGDLGALKSLIDGTLSRTRGVQIGA